MKLRNMRSINRKNVKKKSVYFELSKMSLGVILLTIIPLCILYMLLQLFN